MTNKQRDLPPNVAGVLILLIVLTFVGFLAFFVPQARLIAWVCAGAASVLGAARWIPRAGTRGDSGHARKKTARTKKTPITPTTPPGEAGMKEDG